MNCETCGKTVADCVGHCGYIDLELPVFHVGFFRSTINILQIICKVGVLITVGRDKQKMYVYDFLDSEYYKLILTLGVEIFCVSKVSVMTHTLRQILKTRYCFQQHM